MFRARGRSMLSGDRKSHRDYADGASSSRFLTAISLLLIHICMYVVCMYACMYVYIISIAI